MIIRARIIILSLSRVPHFGLTKTSELAFIRCHQVQLESYRMVVMTSMHAPSYHDDVRACALMVFVPYPLNKFILTWSFYY